MENKIIFKNKKVNEAKEVNDKIFNQEPIEDIKVNKIDKYIQQLNPLQLVAYEIAKTRLKSSFDIEKSIGFKSFNLF
jgi:hypothetical protein